MFNAVMQYDLGEDVNALREMVHRWAQERVKPMAAEVDQSNVFPHDLWKEMGYITYTPGDAVDYQIVEQWIIEFIYKHRFRAQETAYDRQSGKNP